MDTTCKPLNTARTCGSFSEEGGPCTGLSEYPNATVVDYGSIMGERAMQKALQVEAGIARTAGVPQASQWSAEPPLSR